QAGQLRERKTQIGTDSILVQESVNGEMRGAYRIGFKNGGPRNEEQTRAVVDSVLEIVDLARARLLKEALKKDFAGLNNEQEVLNWALTLATAGGFFDMPLYAAESNRAVVLVPNPSGELVGGRAIGARSVTEHGQQLAAIATDIYKEGVERFLRRHDQSLGALYERVFEQTVGPNIVQTQIEVRDGQTIFDDTKCDDTFDTLMLRKLREGLEGLLKVDGQTISNYLLLPIKGEDGKPLAAVYIDSAFSRAPLTSAKLVEIFNAAGERISQLRAKDAAK
ncbi:MAG TPA: hypothetical protein VMT55_02820, partial [Candidatus Sulfotelmatobacter sp.]|nr:hypothetical protein [Candidatus Sulfotelmatobacter sp.]